MKGLEPVLDAPMFAGLTIDMIRTMSPGELAAWCRGSRERRGVILEGRTCRTCGGDGALEGGAAWCPDCDGNGVEKPPVCTVCAGHGVVRSADSTPTNVTSSPCPACGGGSARLDGLLDRAGVPRFYQTFTWAGWDTLPEAHATQSEAWRLGLALACAPKVFREQHGKLGLCLVGPPGSRKTGLCVPVFRDLAGQHYLHARFLSWRSWLDDMAATWRGHSPVTAADMIREAVSADVLMVDDFGGALGAGDARPWVAETAWKLLEGRQSVNGPVLVTTNRMLAEIEREYGEATVSRLHALCLVVNVRGNDERRRETVAA